MNLIAKTRTKTGLEIQSILDENEYKTGKKVSDKEMYALNIEGDTFHPEWNYTIRPYYYTPSLDLLTMQMEYFIFTHSFKGFSNF